MRWNHILLRGLAFGLVTGMILGLLFKWIEAERLANVYTLLLNVDFIPFLPEHLPEWQEFALHLLVSLIIGVVYSILLHYRRWPWIWGLLLGIAPITLFMPLTERTPNTNDTATFYWWIVGHLVYGVCLALLGLRTSRRRRSLHFP